MIKDKQNLCLTSSTCCSSNKWSFTQLRNVWFTLNREFIYNANVTHTVFCVLNIVASTMQCCSTPQKKQCSFVKLEFLKPHWTSVKKYICKPSRSNVLVMHTMAWNKKLHKQWKHQMYQMLQSWNLKFDKISHPMIVHCS